MSDIASTLAPHPLWPLERGAAPTFSVILPAYQAASFIAEAVESALDQTVPPHEIVISDDGSTDDLEGSLAAYADRLVVVRTERHNGVAAARNAAARAASGDFVVMLDADDAYLPGRLEALGELAACRPDLDILCTDAFMETGGRVAGRFNRSNRFAVDDQRTAILHHCFCAWPAIRRSRLLAFGGFDESLTTASDWEMMVRLILGGSAAGLADEPLYRHRVRERSLTSDRVSTLSDRVTLLERTRDHPGLRPGERRELERSIARQRHSLLLAQAETATSRNGAGARARLLEAALVHPLPWRTRLRVLPPLLAPGLLRRRAALGHSKLARSLPRQSDSSIDSTRS